MHYISELCQEKDQWLDNNPKHVSLTKHNTVATITNSNPKILPDILLFGTAVINTNDPNYNKFEWVITFNKMDSKSRLMMLDCGVEIKGKHSCYLWFRTLYVSNETQVKIVIDFQEKQMSLLDRNDKLHRQKGIGIYMGENNLCRLIVGLWENSIDSIGQTVTLNQFLMTQSTTQFEPQMKK